MFRALRLAAVLMTLAACERSGARDPFFESRAPPGLASRFLAPEGWAWGAIQVGESPVQRYGVASPPGVPRGDVLIVPGYGETAEVWFETANDLTDAGLTVWVLDRAGQGGSGRFVGPRDLGHAPGFEPDVAALEALVTHVIRPAADRPLTILAHADGAAVALLAAERGLPLDRLALSAPRLAAPQARRAGFAAVERTLGLDRTPPVGWKPWRRDPSAAKSRPHLAAAWQLANPDLRMSGPSRGWEGAFATASAAALEGVASVRAPVLELGRTSGQDPCPRLPRCRKSAAAAHEAAPHLADEPVRRDWLAETVRFALDQPLSAGG